MESTFFDFNDFGDFDIKIPKENLKESRRNSILFIISLFLIIILGIISILKGNELSNIMKQYNELYNETYNLQVDSNKILQDNIEKRVLLVNVYNSRKQYQGQYEKDEKKLNELKEDNEKLKKTNKNLNKENEKYKENIKIIQSEIVKLEKIFSQEQDKNLELMEEYQKLKEEKDIEE